MTARSSGSDDTTPARDGEADERGASDDVATDTVEAPASGDAPDDPAGRTGADADRPDAADADEVDDAGSGPAGQGGAEAELAALKEDFEALNDRHLRLAAEFNNYRRRSEQERLSAWERAQAELVGQLLDVLDDLQRVAALDLSSATVEAIMEGIDLVERKFVRALGDAGAEPVDPVGQPFDPERMEAMMRVPTENEDEDDTVAEVFQKGYRFRNTLVRPARVTVYKHEG